MNDFTIVGGGVAGLSCAIRLAELGHTPTLIDAGHYPAHKVCGEFFSPECLPILDKWGLKPQMSIRQVKIHTPGRSIAFQLPQAAGSHSRFAFDHLLAEKADAVGVQLKLGTRVEALDMSPVIVGAGRLVHPPSPPKYIGLKAHFTNIPLPPHTLEMHSLKDAYYGIETIEEGKVNVACLAKPGAITKEELSFRLGGTQLFDWMEVRAPEFGPKQLPTRPNTYYIGDAAGTIPPACGDGLAMGITSGIMCAEYAHLGDWQGFARAWQRRYASRLRWGRLVHQAMLRPSLAALLPRFLGPLFFRLTREKINGYDVSPN